MQGSTSPAAPCASVPRRCCVQERHPADQGLSCYEQPFEGKFTRWSFNLTGGLGGDPGIWH